MCIRDSLKVVQIGGDSLTDDDLKSLSMPAGAALGLNKAPNISVKGIEYLVGQPIKILYLNGEQIDDAVIPQLERMATLEQLTFNKTSISPKGIEQLRISRPKLKVEMK